VAYVYPMRSMWFKKTELRSSRAAPEILIIYARTLNNAQRKQVST